MSVFQPDLLDQKDEIPWNFGERAIYDIVDVGVMKMGVIGVEGSVERC